MYPSIDGIDALDANKNTDEVVKYFKNEVIACYRGAFMLLEELGIAECESVRYYLNCF